MQLLSAGVLSVTLAAMSAHLTDNTVRSWGIEEAVVIAEDDALAECGILPPFIPFSFTCAGSGFQLPDAVEACQQGQPFRCSTAAGAGTCVWAVRRHLEE